MDDMKLSGSGTIPGGDYAAITISGSGTLSGAVSCTAFSSAGAVVGDTLACAGEIKSSGKVTFLGQIKAKSIKTDGTLSCGADLIAVKAIDSDGTLSCKGSVKCETLAAHGAIRVNGEIKAWQVSANGGVCVDAIIAEEISLNADGKTNIGRMEGSKIAITMSNPHNWCRRIPLVSAFFKNTTVTTSITGEDVSIAYVDCPQVTGSHVTIGDGCRVELVQYREQVEISPRAKVGRVEKLEN